MKIEDFLARYPDHNFRFSTEAYTHCMVDVETTGLRPDRNHMFQIGAVLFNLERRTVDPHPFVITLTRDQVHRSWDESTREWWLKKKDVLTQILSMPAMSSKDGMVALHKYAKKQQSGNSISMVGKPSHFDYPWVESYFRDTNTPSPFHYREVTDMNTWAVSKLEDYVSGSSNNEILKFMYQQVPEFEGAAHNAIFDCLYQIKCMFWVKDFIEGKLNSEYYLNHRQVYRMPEVRMIKALAEDVHRLNDMSSDKN